MTETLNIFLSSTSKDLRKHRDKVREIIGLIRAPRCHAVIMEEFNAGDQNALEKCYAELKDAHIFVGIYAYRYGWQPDENVAYLDNEGKRRTGDGKTSVTEWEYIWAKELGIPMLLFVADESDTYKWDDALKDSGETAQALEAFKARVKTQVVGFFNLPDHLAARVGMAINEYIAQSRYTRADGWRLLRPEEPQYFAGRAKETTEILGRLQATKTVLMTGMGGTGKTTLAKHIGKTALATYGGGVLWLALNPAIKKAEDAQLRAIAAWKDAHPQGRVENAQIDVAQLKALLGQSPAPLLAILDDAWSSAVINGIRECLPDGTALLITTRDVSLATPKTGERYELKQLSPDDAVSFLRQRLHLNGEHDKDLREIGAVVGFHALALNFLAAWLERESLSDMPALKRKLSNPQGLFKTLNLGEERDENLEIALELSYSPLNEAEQSAFRLLSALPIGLDFTPELAFAVWGIADEAEALDAADEQLRKLAHLGLLERLANGRYFLHQTLHFYASKLVDDKGEKAAIETAVENYHAKLTELAYGFHELPMQDWFTKLENPYLPHFFRYAAELFVVDIARATKETIQEVSDFFYNSKNLVGYRPQYHLLAWLEKGLEVSQKLAQRSREALFLGDLGSYYQDRGQLGKALNYFDQTLTIRRELKDRKNEGIMLNNIGSIYQGRGQLEQALETFQQALEIQREVGGRRGEGSTLNNIGMIYKARGKLEQALETYQQALLISREVGDRRGEGTTLNNIGMIYKARGQLEQALETYQQALAIQREVGNRSVEGVTLSNIGMIYKARGQLEPALETYQQALLIQREVGDRHGESTTLWNLGLLYEEMGKLNKAIEYIEACITIEEEIQHPNYESDKATLEDLKRRRDTGG